MKYDLASSTEELGIAGVSVVKVLSSVLERMIDQSRHCDGAQAQSALSKFQSSSVPGISVVDYLQRISSFAKCSDSCFIVALVYLDRLIESRRVALTVLNVYRLMITTVLVAAKMFEDEYFNNSFYARLGGVSVAELNVLELEFVKLLGFSTHVDVATSNRYFLEFWKLDPGCVGRPLSGFILDALSSRPAVADVVPPVPVLTREVSEESGMSLSDTSVGSPGAGGAPPCAATVCVHGQVATPHPLGHGGIAAPAPPMPRPTRAIRFPMPPEYFPTDAAGYAQGLQGNNAPPAGYGCAPIYPVSRDPNGHVMAPPAPGHCLKVQTEYSPYGAVNYGMGYARNDVSDFGAGLKNSRPHSVSNKMSPFERRTEEN
jgi:hypothetical protein